MKTNNQKKIDFITNNILGKCFILDNSKDDDPERNGYYIFSTPSLINLDDSPNFFKKGIFVHGQLQTSFHISMFDGEELVGSTLEIDYLDELLGTDDGDCQIVKVERPAKLETIWVRSSDDLTEMTIEEIENKLGLTSGSLRIKKED